MFDWWRGFVTRHIVADVPHPELSRLDRMDGLRQWCVKAEHYENGNPCWTVYGGPDGDEVANFNYPELASEYVDFKSGALQ